MGLIKSTESARLFELEEEASVKGLLLRIQIRRPLRLWTIKLVVAEEVDFEKMYNEKFKS